MWRGWLSDAWHWLSQNKDAIGSLTAIVGVAVAIAGVIVAAIYARLTRRLAEAARDQSALAKEITTETRRQAEVSQRIFEASHRPYLELMLDEAQFGDEEQFIFRFSAKNHGSVPAVQLRWSVVLRDNDGRVVADLASGITQVVFPGAAVDFEAKRAEGTFSSKIPQGLRVEARLDYWGSPEREYSTRFTAEWQRGHGWQLLQDEIG
jgi:hypothetical protein